ncbi:ubiquitin carboxyl-terminal hydrolase 37 [Chiloscyllium plagiosum]|uniref:ubiquitin carboxyl-terminal hydrolase 37 n=1 Tax=Chiloscyllium plagiosum TaxID=36176 RepID=UPI001CB7E9D8|nr:ubiquitin carboxyl-terminal hydrolase 37 [Chiloscyllium plagiosum]XP_043550293.1 ubiquitin carboxyl-terminal hydrolase 37 [Chiloscyllium plagiosum]XP_043550294.1 ubiquitin carboxyl-terminal hydrolase 37 [Chiloscyllium plagiosum]
MAPMKIYGQIRINSIQTGTTKWREGSFEIVEKDNKASLVVLFNSGGPAKTFQLSHNVKVVKISPSMKQQSRLLLTLQDKSSLIIDKAPSTDALNLKEYLENLNRAGVKSHQGSGNFGGNLGNRIPSKDSHRQRFNIENQTPTRRDETPTRKTLGSPGRATLQHGAKTPQSSSSPGNRMGTALTLTSHALPRTEKRKRMLTPDLELTEDYPKENDSSSNNKVTGDTSRKYLSSYREKQLSMKQAEESRSSGTMPLQSFYGSRASSKDYSAGNSFLDRSSLLGQVPSAKRNLGFLPQPIPQSVKKLRANQDYTGWNRPRVPHATQLPQPLQGFSNLGNTCYMNAILQSLFSLQSLATDLLKQGIPWKKIPANALLKRFAHLLIKKDNCSPEVKKELLKRVKNAISTTAERFSGYVQNDAHEFLSQCLDQLKEDMEKLNKTWKNELVTGEDSPAARGCHEAVAARVFTCPIVSNVEFEVLHTIGCKTCCESVTKREQFNDLSIDLPRRKKLLPPRSIQDSLDLFFRAEEIEYSCEKCNGKSAIVTHKFSRLPRVLILHLKRYSFNVQLSVNNKLGQQVIIPKYLTLAAHCTETTRQPFSLGWNTQSAISRPLKTSQSVNSTTSASTLGRKYCFRSAVVILDSDSEEEQVKRAMVVSRQLNEQVQREVQQEEEEMQLALKASKRESSRPASASALDSSFDSMSEDELLAAVLEISKRETRFSFGKAEEQEKPSSSPDTGFGDDEAQELLEQHESPEPDGPRAPVEMEPAEVTKDFDENKENKTPEDSQCEMDWMQQYDLDREREEQELQQALAQSLQEQEAREMKEDDDLKRATELSIQEFNNCIGDLMGSDEDSGNEEILDMDYSEVEAEELKRNAETGELAHSYRLISVVSHIGSSSSSGHYISDVYDIKKQTWLTYNDLEVSKTMEGTVQSDRDKSGYIFFYMHKEILEELAEEEEKCSQPTGLDSSRPVLQPL